MHIQLRLAAWTNLCDKQNESRYAQILSNHGLGIRVDVFGRAKGFQFRHSH
jgi:hypothetical protein